MKKTSLIVLTVLAISLGSCRKKRMPAPESGKFKVTIENVFEAKSFFNSGTIGGIPPGMSKSFSFNAGKGHRLSFATMFAQSNDLFYAPDDNGLALYDASGNAVTGDVTSQIYLWDAGTEVNEEPGVGPNQPPRQSGPNTGASESNPVAGVNDSFTYPATNTVIKVELAHDGGTKFTVTITNVSNNASLATPLAPGVWVVNTENQHPIFTEGNTASSMLEGLAEDGNNTPLADELSANAGYFSPFAPGAYSIGNGNEIFTLGQTSSADLEKLAEDGSPAGYSHVFNTPDGASSAGPLLPAHSYSFTFDAEEGDKLSFATMLVQSNDWFVGADKINLFNNGVALTGDITSQVKLFDAGTEVDEYAGAGNNQPLRQSGPNTGAAENGNVSVETSPSSNVPDVSSMVKVTITKF